MTTSRPRYVFFGHHKCATKFILGILRQVCRDNGLRLRSVSNDEQLEADPAESPKLDWLAFPNARWDRVASLGDYRGFHIIRDPRDVLVSAYYSHLNSHETTNWPELIAHRNVLRSMSKSEGLMSELSFSECVFAAMRDWPYDREQILEVRFERLVACPYKTFLNIFDFLGCLVEDVGLTRRLGSDARASLNHLTSFRLNPLPLRVRSDDAVVVGRVSASV